MRKVIICLVALSFLATGCAGWNRMTGQEEKPKPKTEGLNQAFYSFPDIPVPKELTLNRDKSFVYETQAFKAGVLVLSGKVEIESLENYFKVSMMKNGWRFINSYKYSDVIFNFMKDDKSANIRMNADTFNTHVEIWVGPIQQERSIPDRPVLRGNEPK
jgi:PBP1b-binding outer membrane lipoprotein LpoB